MDSKAISCHAVERIRGPRGALRYVHVRLTVEVVEAGEIIVHLMTKADPRDRQARSIEQLDSCEKKLRMCPGSRNTQELARAKLVASHKAVGRGRWRLLHATDLP